MLEFLLCALVACATLAFVYWKLHRSNLKYIPRNAEVYLEDNSGRMHFDGARVWFYAK